MKLRFFRQLARRGPVVLTVQFASGTQWMGPANSPQNGQHSAGKICVLQSEQNHSAHEARRHRDADSESPHDNNSILSGIQWKE